MRAQFIFENLNKSTEFEPEYFELPYQIPEDRFKKGLLKRSNHNRSDDLRELKLDYSNLKYKDVLDYQKRVDLNKVNAQIKLDIKNIQNFLLNNPLTGRTLINCDYHDNMSLKEYLKGIIDVALEVEYADDTEPLGLIDILPNLQIAINYDIYKGRTIFTFYEGNTALFYYYTVFTLDKNDVTGSGENYTYITVNDFKKYVFYETFWRQILIEKKYIGKLISFLKYLNLNRQQYEEIIENISEGGEAMLNSSIPIINNYFNSNFIKYLSETNYQEEDDLSNEDNEDENENEDDYYQDDKDLFNKDSQWIKDNNEKEEWHWDNKYNRWWFTK